MSALKHCIGGALLAALVVFAAGAAQADTFTVTCPSSTNEGAAGETTNVQCTMTRTGGTHAGVIPWQVTFPTTGALNIRASAADFVATSGMVTFTANTGIQMFNVQVKGDDDRENSETFLVNSNPPLGHTAGSAAIVSIHNDDITIYTLTSDTTAVTETDSNTGVTVTFTVTRTGVDPNGVRDIRLTIAGGSGLDLDDFVSGTMTTSVVRLQTGVAVGTHTYTIAGDDESEGDESFTVAISSTTGTVMPTTPISVTITDDDDDVSLALNPAPTASVAEGSRPAWSIRYTASDAANTALAAAVTVRVRIFNNVVNDNIFSYPLLQERVFGKDWTGGSGEVTQPNRVVMTFNTTVPMGLADGADHTIGEMPTVADDDFAENIEHYELVIDIEAANAPAGGGGIAGNSREFHTIAASDPLQVTVPTGNLDGLEGSSDVRKRITITREDGSPIAGGTNPWDRAGANIRLDYNDGSDQNIEEVWETVRTNGYVDLRFGGTDDTPEDHFSIAAVTVQRIRSFNLNWEFTAAPAPFSVSVQDDDPQAWVVSAIDPGGALTADVAEDADTYADPNNAEGNAEDGYFRIFDVNNINTRSATTITYCIYGTATGGAATEDGRDFTWPSGYDPDADVSSTNPLCTSGSGVLQLADDAGPRHRIPLDIHDDGLNEGDETILIDTVSATGADNYRHAVSHSFYTGDNSYAIRTIKDNDDIAVSIAIAGEDADTMTAGHQVGEGRSAMFSVTLGGAGGGSASAVTVPYTISGDVAAADLTGITSLTGTLTIAIGQSSAVLAIPLEDDADTASEDLTVTLDASGYTAAGTIARTTTAADQSATVQVVDRLDARTLTLTRYTNAAYQSVRSSSLSAELNDNPTLNIYLRIGIGSGDTAFSNPTAVTWTVNHADTNGTSDADFSAVTGTVMMTNQVDFTITYLSDDFNEGAEMFTVSLSVADSTADGGTNADATHSATIAANDPIVLSHSGAAMAAEGSTATVNVALGVTASSEITVAYTLGSTAATTDVDAVAADYTAGSGSITIAAGETNGDISIPILADNLNEPDETFTVSVALTGVTGGFGTVGGAAVEHTFTIPASDPVTATIAPPSPATVNEGATATFTITLSGATAGLGQDLTLAYTASGTTDTPTVASGTLGSLVLAAGATTSANLELAIPSSSTLGLGDPDETLSVTLDSISGGASIGSQSSASVTVSYQDAARTLTITGPATIAEGAADVESGNYTITLSGTAFPAATDVTWTVTHGGTADADFVAASDRSGTVSFGTTDTSHTFTMTVDDDNLNEGDETFSVQASVADPAAHNGTAFGSPLVTTITDNADDAITVTIANTDTTAAEGDDTTFSVTLAGGVRSTPVIVPFTVTTSEYFTAADFDITTPSGIDATATGGTVTFPVAGATATDSMNIVVAVAGDSVNEAAEVLTLAGAAAGATGLRTAGAISYAANAADDSVTIGQSDSAYASIVRAAGETGAVNEGGVMSFTMRIRQFGDVAPIVSDGDICVPFTTALTQSAMATNDATSGPDIELIAPNNGTCADRDTALTVPANGAVTSSVVIRAGQSSADFQIRARFDNIDEGATAETLTVSIPVTGVGFAGAGAVLRSGDISVDVDITNINAARSLALAGPTAAVDEGGNLAFTASITGQPVTTAFAVEWAVTSGSDDVTPTSGTLNFAVGGTMQAITLAATDDAADEADETVTVTLSDPCPAAPAVCNVGGRPDGFSATAPALRLAAASANGTISESDRPVTLSVTALGGALSEGTASNFAVGFSESVTTTAAVTATWMLSFSGGTASAADFATLTGAATIPAGQSSVNIPITATADNLNEAAETFTFTLSNPAGGGAIAAPALHAAPSAMASIAASDPLTARIARSSAQTGAVTEGGDAQFSVSLALTSSSTTAATSAAPICVTFTTAVTQSSTLAAGASPNTAQNPDIAVDNCSGMAVTVNAMGVATGGVTIPAGESSALIAITARFDNEDEGSNNETLTVTLSGATHTGLTGAAAVTPDTTAATAEIANSNALRTLAVSPPATAVDEDSVTEAGQTAMATFTITLGGSVTPETDVVVPWSLTSPDRSLTLPSASGLARTFHTTDLAPGQAQSGTVTFPAGTALTPPATRTVSVQIAQDALNEGAEQLQLQIGMVPQTAGCTGTPTVPCTLVADRMAQATVAASDDITIFLAPAGDQGTLLAGDSARYVMSFGSTTVNGQAVPIVPTAPLTVPVMVDVGGRTEEIRVMVPANEPTAEVTVPAATINPPGQTGTPTLTVSVGTPTGAPAGATVRAGTQADVDALPTGAPNRPAAPAPAPRQTAGWNLSVASGAEAPEGAAYQVVFTLDGDADELSANGLTIQWSIAGRMATGGSQAEAADFAPSTSTPPAYTCGAVNGVCATFPSGGPVTFTTGDSSQTLEIRIRDDGDNENMMPDGFTLTLGPLGGADASRTVATGSLSSTGSLPLEVTIPALRADLSIANATAAEGANAVFALTLANFSGGTATTLPVTVSYRVGVDASGAALFPATDSAERGADYTADAATATVEIAAGAASAVIAVPLLQDGVLESRETFTLTITGATGGGGSIRLVNAAGEQQQISATGTITDDADQSARRKQRVGALVNVLDRQTAIMATDAITARLERNRAAASAQLSIANRNLLGGGGAGTAQSTDDSSLGLALYGAAGLGGASAGLPGSGGGGASGASTGGNYTGGAGGGGAFAGLGAGLAGGANMGSQTALPSLAELMNGSSFAFQATLSNLVEGVQFWGSGGLASLDGNPQGGATLDYDGDNLAFFFGADTPVRENLLAGFALGWASGDLDFTDRAGSFRMDGNLSNDMLSLHPYLGWQVTPNVNAWLMLGFGFGVVDISENEGSGTSRVSRNLNGGDSNMLMVSAGIAGRRQLSSTTDLKLRFEITRVSSDVDAARFDDGALLPGAKGRSGRIGGELELGRRFSFGGVALRPFGSLGLRLDNNDSASASADRDIDEAFDLGGGVTAAWPGLGLDGRFAFSLQLNDTGHEEQRFSLDLNFDPGADSQGLTLAVQTALSEQRSGLLNAASGRSGLGSPLAGASGAAGESRMARSISGELGYGMALRQFGRAALLTPYGRFNLGSADQRWAAGLRLAQPGSGGLQLGIEAGLDLESGRAGSAAAERSYDLLLTGRLRF